MFPSNDIVSAAPAAAARVALGLETQSERPPILSALATGSSLGRSRKNGVVRSTPSFAISKCFSPGGELDEGSSSSSFTAAKPAMAPSVTEEVVSVAQRYARREMLEEPEQILELLVVVSVAHARHMDEWSGASRRRRAKRRAKFSRAYITLIINRPFCPIHL